MAFYENIREISLAGFQTFDKLTRIPIRRLTLLFGPNSAGKSAVEDALEILYELYGHGQGSEKQQHFWADVSESCYTNHRFERLHRHWRRTGEGLDCYAEKMHLGMEGRVDSCSFSMLWDFFPSTSAADEISDEGERVSSVLGEPTSDDNCCHDVRLITEFHLNYDEGDNEIAPRCDVELHINGVPATILVEGEKVGLNIRHWALHLISWPSDFTVFADQYPEYVTYQDGWVWLKKLSVTGRENLFINEYSFYDVSSEIRKLATEITEIYNYLFWMVLGGWSPFDDKPQIVPASRKIPTEQDLVFFLDSWQPSEVYDPDKVSSMVASPLTAFGIKNSGDPQYEGLAQSFIGGTGVLAQNINRMLSDHLFMERGYRLNMDYRVVLSPEEFSEVNALSHHLSDIKSRADAAKQKVLIQVDKLDAPPPKEYENFSLLVRFFLVDSQGREFSFSDVGSGLGYVLPVLCAACGMNLIALIQQPELHLHPALQSALGDVFIEALSIPARGRANEYDAERKLFIHRSKRKLIVETHSEHILLRILKRIRQTHAGNIADNSLSITADEVAVVYFDPSPEGITQVKHLRISEDGDFLDRWPRGFFDERGKELFDE